VRLASNDIDAAPLINPNYWADPHDHTMSIRGLKLAQEILRQDALKSFIQRERKLHGRTCKRMRTILICLRAFQD